MPQGRRLEEMTDIAANHQIEEPALLDQEPREDSMT